MKGQLCLTTTEKISDRVFTCAAKEIIVREIIKDEKSYFSYEIDEEDDEVSE